MSRSGNVQRHRDDEEEKDMFGLPDEGLGDVLGEDEDEEEKDEDPIEGGGGLEDEKWY